MNDKQSLAHTTWNCKYHIVFAPKYRRKAFYKNKREEVGKILRMLCEWKNSVSSFMGYLKGKSSLMLYERYLKLKYKYRKV